MKPLKQCDPKWKNKKLGTGTICDRGCTVTCIAMLADTTPDKIVDEAQFTKDGAIYWQTLKSLKFIWRGYIYENDKVLQAIKDYGGCLVEVNAPKAPGGKHWVLFIGGGKMNDPLTGKTENTSKYKPTGYCILEPLQIINSDMLQDEIIGKSSQRDEVVNHYKFEIGTAKPDELLNKIKNMISGLKGEITKKETEIEELKKESTEPPILEGKRKLLAGIVSSILVFLSKFLSEKLGFELTVQELALVAAGGLSYVTAEGTKDIIEVLKELKEQKPEVIRSK